MDANLQNKLESLRESSYKLQLCSTAERNSALESIKQKLLANIPQIIAANLEDLEKMEPENPLYDRLLLNDDRVRDIASEIDTIISLEDPLNTIIEEYDAPSGIHLKKVSVPLGNIGVIYEARPNVTIDVTTLCLKSGNTILLRGSSNAYSTNKYLVSLIHEALTESRIPAQCVQLLDPDRELAAEMMKADKYLDLIIPRGGASLIKNVRENSTVPIIETGASVVHTFVDNSANLDMACDIIYNEKTRRPSVCNALDTVLVHEEIAQNLLIKLAERIKGSKTVLHCDDQSFELLKEMYPIKLLKNDAEENYDKEFLSLEMNIHLVKDVDEAIDHIRKYSLKHSESIVSEKDANVAKFMNEADAACIYHNTSTAFSDGAQFGLGAEIGISTQKLHARGPMGLKELTSYKWLITSEGVTRK